MPMTVEQIVEEARHLSREKIVELVDRLHQALDLEPAIEDGWRAETRRRITELEAGKVQPIPGAAVAARIRGIVGR